MCWQVFGLEATNFLLEGIRDFLQLEEMNCGLSPCSITVASSAFLLNPRCYH